MGEGISRVTVQLSDLLPLILYLTGAHADKDGSTDVFSQTGEWKKRLMVLAEGFTEAGCPEEDPRKSTE